MLCRNIIILTVSSLLPSHPHYHHPPLVFTFSSFDVYFIVLLLASMKNQFATRAAAEAAATETVFREKEISTSSLFLFNSLELRRRIKMLHWKGLLSSSLLSRIHGLPILLSNSFCVLVRGNRGFQNEKEWNNTDVPHIHAEGKLCTTVFIQQYANRHHNRLFLVVLLTLYLLLLLPCPVPCVTEKRERVSHILLLEYFFFLLLAPSRAWIFSTFIF